MPDLSIPGAGTSKYGTDKLIEGLMKVERIPRDKAEARLKSLVTQKTVWLDVGQRMALVRDNARALYSFKNPFTLRTAKSSDEELLTATATREAIEQTRRFVVKQVAQADRFISSELAKDYKVPAGSYSFTVGAKSMELRYAGGSLQDFADAVNRKGGDFLRAQVVAVRPESKSLVIESLLTGSANRLSFEGSALEMALKTGMIEKIETSRRDFALQKPSSWQTQVDGSLVAAKEGALSVAASASGKAGEARVSLDAPLASGELVLELRYKLVKLPEGLKTVSPPGPDLGPTGSITYEGLTVEGAPSLSGLPDWVPPPAPPRIEDRAMLSLIGPDGKSAALPELRDGDDTQTMRLRLADYLPEISALGLRVRDTTRRLELLSARVIDPTEAGGYKPKAAISTAMDALLSIDGIDIVRPDNNISDLVPGVTLNLKSASDKVVNLKIEPDREAVQDALISLVGSYNRLVAWINILTRNEESIINELGYFTDEEKKTAKERLGLMQSDSTLSILKSSLQRVMMNPYETKEGQSLALLAQIGIATDARRPGSGQGYDKTRLRGYLEIEEESLTRALAERFDAVRQLFGNDTDGDLVMDSGAAFTMDSLLKPYVETGGIIAIKTGTIDGQMTGERGKIAELDKQLAAKEKDLKRKYGAMEGALNQMQGSAGALDNLNRQGGN